MSDRTDVSSEVIIGFYDAPDNQGGRRKPTPALRFGLSRFQIAAKGA